MRNTCVVLVLGLFSCSFEELPESAEEISEGSADIRAGALTTAYPSVVRLYAQEYLAPDVIAYKFCTGVAMRPDGVGSSMVVLTSADCIPIRNRQFDGGVLSFRIFDVNNRVMYVTEMVFSPDPNAKWALLRLDTTMAAASPLLDYNPAPGTMLSIIGMGLGGNDPNVSNMKMRAGITWLTQYLIAGASYFFQTNHAPGANAICDGDQGAPALVNGKIAGIAYSWVGSEACSTHTASNFIDVPTKRGALTTGYNNLSYPHTACGYARTHYFSNRSGVGWRQAFQSEGMGCKDNRYGNRYYRASYAVQSFATHDSWCRGAGQTLASSALIQLARRPSGGKSHINGDPNQLVWTSEQVDANRAYAIRLGTGSREIHWKTEWLGGVCATTGLPANNDFGHY